MPDDRCPNCGGTDFLEVDCGPEPGEGLTYVGYECRACGLWLDGYKGEWLTPLRPTSAGQSGLLSR